MIVRILKSSFTGGEWSPGLYGRTDMEQYYTACKRLENMIVHPYGGISNRAGTYFVGETTAGSKLVPFQFSVIQSYVLEFSNLQMRIIKDGGFVCYPVGHAQAGQIVTVTTAYTTDDLKLLKYTQSADILYLSHRNHPVRKLGRTDHHLWTLTDIAWCAKILPPSNFVRTAGTGVTNSYCVTAVSDSGEESLPSAVVSSDKGATFEFDGVPGASYYNIYKDSDDSGFYGWIGKTNNAKYYEPFPPPVPVSPTTVLPVGASGTTAPVNFVRSSGADHPYYQYFVTAVISGKGESAPSNIVSAYPWTCTFTWDAVPGASSYCIYKSLVNYTYTNQATFSYGKIATVYKLQYKEKTEGITPDVDKGFPTYLNRFRNASEYPNVSTFFQQRLLLGSSMAQPQTIWGSTTGNFENMNDSSPPRDDDSYEFTLNSNQVNEIRWFVPMDALLIGTSGAEWKMSAGGKTNAVTASSVQLSKQSQWGSSHLQPIVIGSTILFVTASQKSVRDFLYDVNIDSFAGADLNILAGHLTESNKIIDWAYQQDPYSIIWMVRDDGMLLGLTYYRDHKIFGWHRHNTDGKFKSIACINTNYGESEVYFTVERVINGATKYYIEKLMPRIKDNELKESFFVDCGLTYRGVPNDEMLGLGHLEGKAVSIFADGNVVAGLTVTNGKVTLPNKASIVHIGLPYRSVAQTLEFDFPTHDSSSAQDRKKYLVSVFYRLLNSRALKIGVDEENTVETPFRTDELYNEPTRLFTGVKESNINTCGESGTSLTIVNDEPVPMTLLSMMAKISVDA